MEKNVKRLLTCVIAAIAIVGGALSANAMTSAESEMVRRVNGERTARGTAALRVASDLVAVARQQSARMAARHSIYHNPNLGSDVNGWTLLAENVGVGPTVKDVHDAFMKSSMHRPHILDPRFREIGVGIVRGDDGYLYITEIFARRSSSSGSTSTTTSRTSSTSTSTRRTTTRVAAAAPRPAAPAPAPILQKPQTVDALLRLAALEDADLPFLGGVAGI